MARGARARLGADVAVVGDGHRRARAAGRPRSRSGSSTCTRRGPAASARRDFIVPGDRETVRARAAVAALHLVRTTCHRVVTDTSQVSPLAWPASERFASSARSASPTTRSTRSSRWQQRELARRAGSSRPTNLHLTLAFLGSPAGRRAAGDRRRASRRRRRAPAASLRGARLPRDAERRDAHLRRRGRRARPRSPGACTGCSRSSASTGARRGPGSRTSPCCGSASGRASTRRCPELGEVVRPTRLFTFPAAARWGAVRGSRTIALGPS